MSLIHPSAWATMPEWRNYLVVPHRLLHTLDRELTKDEVPMMDEEDYQAAQQQRDELGVELKAVMKQRKAVEDRAVPELPKLVAVACRDTGQSEICRRFLLGLYNGYAFPFNLNRLRVLDGPLRDAALAVLDMDTYGPQAEIHNRLNGLHDLILEWREELEVHQSHEDDQNR